MYFKVSLNSNEVKANFKFTGNSFTCVCCVYTFIQIKPSLFWHSWSTSGRRQKPVLCRVPKNSRSDQHFYLLAHTCSINRPQRGESIYCTDCRWVQQRSQNGYHFPGVRQQRIASHSRKVHVRGEREPCRPLIYAHCVCCVLCGL